MKTLFRTFAAGLLCGLTTAHAQSGGDYVITKSTVDGGGVSQAVGGDYVMSGTAGQHDAAEIAGGDYVLTGGFWSPQSGPAGAPDPVLPDPDGPAGGLACDDTGGNYGLPCQTCSGGGRNGLPCNANTDCPGGGTCTANGALCAGGSCNMQLAHLKNRFIGFIAPASTGGLETAIRLRLVSIDGNPNCDGEIRWATPPQSFNEGNPGSPTFLASALEVGAAPLSWRDWSADGLVHLYGEEIIPGSTYEVQIVDRGCENTLGDPTCYSTPLVVQSAKWGDVFSPTFPFTPATQPDVSDISALVAKFGGASGAIAKARAKLVPHAMNPALLVDVSDISACVSAFQGNPYANAVTSCP